MSKYKAHVPTEQFGFIEVEDESLEGIVEEYNKVKYAFDDTGIPESEMNRMVDELMQEGSINGSPDNLIPCSEKQNYAIQVIKRAIKRADYKLNGNKNE